MSIKAKKSNEHDEQSVPMDFPLNHASKDELLPKCDSSNNEFREGLIRLERINALYR